MIATHKYSPLKTGGITLSYSHLGIPTSTSYIYATAFFARLNGLQVDRENDKRTCTYTRLVLSKLVDACNPRLHVTQVFSSPGVA